MHFRKSTRVLAALAAALISLGSAGAIHAEPPTVTEINQTFTDDFSCSFPMVVNLQATIRRRVDGNVTREVWSSSRYTWTNPANGKTVTGVTNGPGVTTVNPDGSTTVKVTGSIYNVTVPGAGKILHTGGQTVFFIPADPMQPTTVTLVGGKDGQLSDLCPYMGS
jgi:hypothetical protein